jgi:CRP-like cAMP-binding protein
MVRSDDKPTVEMLREIKLLNSLTDPELAQLTQLGTGATYESHANIVIEGELSWGLYLILDGMVGIFKTNKMTGESYDVGQIKKAGFFGEMSLIDNNPRSATVKTLMDTRVFHISKDDFYRFLNQSQNTKIRFYENCVKNLVSRLRELDDNYVVSQYQLWKVALKKEAA